MPNKYLVVVAAAFLLAASTIAIADDSIDDSAASGLVLSALPLSAVGGASLVATAIVATPVVVAIELSSDAFEHNHDQHCASPCQGRLPIADDIVTLAQHKNVD